MKTNLFRRFKWYIVGFMLIVIMLSVGLSFCSWDNLSVQALNAKANAGNYAWSTYIKGANGETLITQPEVGDIVQYGRYYQAAGATVPTAQRWIVVDIDANNVATLLTEKVVVYGNFWGQNREPYIYYQNYYQSTLRAWLNSGRDSVVGNGTNWAIGKVATKDGDENWRDDGIGSAFSGTSTNQANRGFLDVAFSDIERTIIMPKNISGIQGYGKNTDVGGVQAYTTRNGNLSINDLVWLPSYTEIYGEIQYHGDNILDGTSKEQFQYFKNADYTVGINYNTIPTAIASATDYAFMNADGISNYYNEGYGGYNNSQTATWWWLRSPFLSDCRMVLFVNTDGSGGNNYTYSSAGGVRPAVCVQL